MKISKSVIKKARNGEKEAINEVLERTLSFLEDFIGSHIESIADRDDLIQEALIAINKNLKKYNPKLPFDDWVAGYAWKYINRYRSGEYPSGIRDQSLIAREITFTDWLGDVELEDIEGEIPLDHIIT